MNATQQKFKPILFSTEMVQAILAGRKTQTRRVCEISPEANIMGFYVKRRLWDSSIEDNPNPIGHIAKFNWGEVKSKYQPGDIVYIRETFTDELYGTFYPKNGFFYKADDELPKPRGDRFDPVWKPSIHMPKEAARIFLKVTNVRVERLQDISCQDCKEEGVVYYKQDNIDVDDILALEAFMNLWQKINAKKHPWESNPWVWVYTFERIEKPQNFN